MCERLCAHVSARGLALARARSCACVCVHARAQIRPRRDLTQSCQSYSTQALHHPLIQTHVLVASGTQFPAQVQPQHYFGCQGSSPSARPRAPSEVLPAIPLHFLALALSERVLPLGSRLGSRLLPATALALPALLPALGRQMTHVYATGCDPLAGWRCACGISNGARQQASGGVSACPRVCLWCVRLRGLGFRV